MNTVWRGRREFDLLLTVHHSFYSFLSHSLELQTGRVHDELLGHSLHYPFQATRTPHLLIDRIRKQAGTQAFPNP